MEKIIVVKILARDSADFQQQLIYHIQREFRNVFNVEYESVAISMKDAPDYDIQDYITEKFHIAEKEYRFNGEFVSRYYIEEKIKPFCKYIIITFSRQSGE